MKKILAVVLALTMIVGMSIPAFAEEVLNKDLHKDKTSDTYNVTVDYVPNGEHVIGADVVWSGMEFTYNQGAWDPDKLAYDSGWAKDINEGTIKVTNLSNTALKVTVKWDAALTGATATFTGEGVENNAAELAAVVDETDTVDAVIFNVTVNVKGAVAPEDDGNVGTITVTIADANPVQA